ncbi:MAG: hypothetical protein L0Z71_10045 [Anaerolineae bacterium]|nr:hypothetical protein [Anaerolineae bacterium]
MCTYNRLLTGQPVVFYERHSREPKYSKWIVDIGEDWEDNADRVNALTYEANHDKPWIEIHQIWRDGFLQLLD